ncbi:tRNA-dihydrouridine synthase [uncultured Clostridium sp.]|uniref:oxidoreductase n=1 Tax=uncultured Clostridium sp. TaxID=59620 RepID=UPI0028E66629|nr:tRNA-dihydrouridine synthase [uncultured Clostridium sp.]
MFASPIANKREDKYGGELRSRLLLVENIVKDIKEFTDDDFIISYRMGWNDDLNLDIKTAQALESIGLESLHISSGIPNDRKIEIMDDFKFNDIVYTATQIKSHVNIPIIAVNDIQTLNRGNSLLENNLCDFVAYGRPFLADGAFMERSLHDYNYKPCFGCKNCRWFIDGKKCPGQIKSSRSNSAH